jgi:uracil-DNA glycosylase family 4
MVTLKRSNVPQMAPQEQAEWERRRSEQQVVDVMAQLAALFEQAGIKNEKLFLNTRPILPPNMPGLPPPGPDFLRVSALLANGIADDSLAAEYLLRLMGMALYDLNFTMPVVAKAQTIPVRFIPGHIWRPDREEIKYGPLALANVMIVGKMPTDKEAALGRNLGGATGRILRDALERVGVIGYNSWYTTNLVKFPMPAQFVGGALPQSFIKDCAPLLAQELRIVRPKYVLCLGSEAAKEFLGPNGKVTVSANRVFEQRIQVGENEWHEYKLMTAQSPGAVARTPELFDEFSDTMRLFNAMISGVPLGTVEEKFNIEVIRTMEEGLDLAGRLRRDLQPGPGGTVDISIDGEWHKEYPTEPGAHVRTIQIAWSDRDAAVFMLHDDNGVPAFEPATQAIAPVLEEIFRSTPERPVCAITHYGRADLPWIRSLGFDLLPYIQAPPDTAEKAGFVQFSEGCACGWDTGLCAHALKETDEFKLELQCSRYARMIRWDGELQTWKREYCTANKLESEELEGYGPCPDRILVPYGAKDAIGTWRLKQYQYPKLFSDDYGQDAWLPYWISMRAVPACVEIEDTGLMIDMTVAQDLTKKYQLRLVDMVAELREQINWFEFNPRSAPQCKELLFGVGFSGTIDKTTGRVRKVSPDSAKLCALRPIKSSSKACKKSWDELVRSGEAGKYSPSTDKETLGILALDNDVAKKLRNVRFISQLLSTTLRPPSQDKKTKETIYDDDGNPIYEKGLLQWVMPDSRIRSHINQCLETGRWAFRRPNLQNISKRREADYFKIMGAKRYPGPLRAMFVAPPGHVLIEADFVGAELAVMAWMSQDPTMMEHARRAMLPENHPDYYDIHSNIAVKFFQLLIPNDPKVVEEGAKKGLILIMGASCPPTKQALEICGHIHLRVAAKNVIFGYAYGRGAKAIARQCKEESKPGQTEVTVEQAQILIDGLAELYPGLVDYFQGCKRRVVEPGWIRNPFGRLRRFRAPDDTRTPEGRMILGELERQCMNFPIQSAVADAMNRAVDNLYQYRETHDVQYKIACQIHDAVILEVPLRHIDEVYDVVLPKCLTEMVDIWPCNYDGYTLPSVKEPYHLGADRDVHVRWSGYVTAAEAAERGIPARFIKEKK